MSTTLWHHEPTVFAVDRDGAFCQALRHAGRGLEFCVEVYAAWGDFLQAVDFDRRGCVAVDPGLLGVGVAESIAGLAHRGVHLPVIVVSARGDVPLVVDAMRAGALNYLQKPCETERLAAALQEAVAWDSQHARGLAEAARFHRRLKRLSPGELQVLEMLLQGRNNQEVAAALGLSVRAIEARRAKIREKTRTRSLAEVIHHLVADRGGLDRQPPPVGGRTALSPLA